MTAKDQDLAEALNKNKVLVPPCSLARLREFTIFWCTLHALAYINMISTEAPACDVIDVEFFGLQSLVV